MTDLRQLLDDLKEKVSMARQESERLEQDESEERKYLKKDDIPDSLDVFSEETDLAVDIAGKIEGAEEDEIQAEQVLSGEGQVPEEIGKKFDEAEPQVEQLVKHFLEEVSQLRKEGKALQQEMQDAGVQRSRRENFQEDMNELEEALTAVKDIKDEGKIMMNRRKFLGAAAGTAAAASGAKTFSESGNPVKKATEIEKSRAQEVGGSQEMTRREASKPHANVKSGDGKTVEEINLEGQGVYAEVEVLRTSADTGLTIIKMTNRSERPVEVDLSVSMNQLSISGLIGFDSSSGFTAGNAETLRSGETFSSGAIFYNSGGSPGSIDYKLYSRKEGQEQPVSEEITLDMPQGMLTDHAVTNEREISELELDYRVIENEGNYRFEVNVRNAMSSRLVADITLGIPSGWSWSGLTNVKQAGGGLINTEQRLSRGYSASMRATLHRNSESASSIGTLTLTVWPVDQPQQANYYLMPVDLE